MYPMEEDDELDEENDIVRDVGLARETPEAFLRTPQGYLEATHHPYAPFTGDALQWSSWVFAEGTTYEGITRDDTPHGKGVSTVGHTPAAWGLVGTQVGDRYEGEFHTSFAHGVGMYTASSGQVFKGLFTAGRRDGCGIEYDLSPWKALVAKGVHPVKAWRRVKGKVLESVSMGTWNNGVYLGPATDTDVDDGMCSVRDVHRIMRETDSVVAKARMFAHKPGGDATFFKSHLLGAPLRPNQHPLHYPHGTLFMAPGPAGQTAAVPDDKELRRLMLREYRNFRAIHDQHNFDYKPARNSLMAKAMRWWRKEEKLREQAKGVEDSLAGRVMRGLQDEPSGESAGARARAQEDIDDSDLLAEAASIMSPVVAAEGRRRESANDDGPRSSVPLGTAFGSVSMSVRQAGLGLQSYLASVSKRAPALPRLGPHRPDSAGGRRSRRAAS